MITYVEADLFTSPAQVLVNTVNTVGVMGKGIALTFKQIYPEMFAEYQHYCENGMFDTGMLWLYKTSHKWILNFPTKKHWRSKSKLEYIEAGLRKFADTYDYKGIGSISFPMLGCGNGELDWDTQVQPLMEHILRPLPIDVYVHLYPSVAGYVPEHRDIEETKRWLRSEPRYLPFEEFWEDLSVLAGSGKVFQTEHEAKAYTVSIDNDDKSLIIVSGSDCITLDRETLQDLWTGLRSADYFNTRDYPVHVNDRGATLSGFLATLPYISQVSLVSKPNMNLCESGVFFKAPSSDGITPRQQILSA